MIDIDTSHNPYFNRWFSAISKTGEDVVNCSCHNPYFNRWFSAILDLANSADKFTTVTILILIDGFLQ